MLGQRGNRNWEWINRGQKSSRVQWKYLRLKQDRCCFWESQFLSWASVFTLKDGKISGFTLKDGKIKWEEFNIYFGWSLHNIPFLWKISSPLSLDKIWGHYNRVKQIHIKCIIQMRNISLLFQTFFRTLTLSLLPCIMTYM